MNGNFNLVAEPWIPVIMDDGSRKHVSLLTIFTGNEPIADLAANPYERIALIRLLICIAMAALGKENLTDETSWQKCRTILPDLSIAYLRSWQHRFNLYGEHAFMQPDDLLAKENGKAPCDKLFLHFASGNNATLFDHHASSDYRVSSDDQLAIALLCYLNFSAGGQHAKCLWSSQETSVSVSLCPCREKSMLHTMIIGRDLLSTIWLNLLTGDMLNSLPHKELGRPIWEMTNLTRALVEGKGIERTLLGRLVPFSRVVKLIRNDRTCVMGEGLKYEQLPASREIMASVYKKEDSNGNETQSYVSASLAKQPWRDLQAILAQKEHCGTLVLGHLKYMPQDSEFVLWTGGLVASQGKNEALVEWSARLASSLLLENNLIIYQSGIEYADKWARKLRSATEDYAARVKGFDGSKKKPMERATLSAAYAQPAERFFWDDLAAHQQVLVDLAEDPANHTDVTWHSQVKKSARNAFAHACPRMNGRQMSAYVRALKRLVEKKEAEHAKN